MKLADKPRLNLLYKYDEIVIPCQHGQIAEIHAVLGSVGEISSEAEYTVKIEKKRQKRTLDANAYMWVLVRKLGEKLRLTDTEVYRRFIREVGTFEIVPIRDDAKEKWIENWQSRGMGWLCEDLGVCRNTEGYSNIKSFYGSSTYDTAEMARLIDSVVEECKLQDIETMTPSELEKLKQQWGV